MHARILRYVDEVARSGSIRAAGSKLNVAPSAISRQIKAIEDEIGTPLFYRGTREMTPTAAGELLLNHIRETFRDMTRTRSMIEDLKGLRRGVVSLGIMSGLAANLVPRCIARFQEINPRVTLRARLLTTGDDILEAVVDGTVDLGVGFDFPARAGVRTHGVALARLGAVMNAQHPLASRSSLRLSDCFAYPLILADDSTVIRPYLDHQMQRLGQVPLASVETNSIEVMRTVAAMSEGITFLTRFDIEKEVEAGNVVYIPVQELSDRAQRLMIVGSERFGTAMPSVFAETLKAGIANGWG